VGGRKLGGVHVHLAQRHVEKHLMVLLVLMRRSIG
jgi:hypothetical protein